MWEVQEQIFLAKVLTNFSVYHTFNDLDEVPKVMLWWSYTKPLFLHFVVVFWNSVSLFVSHLFEHIVSVGYEYESCASLILWEKRTAILQGYELDPTSLGGWSLDKHHILNPRSGMFK